MTTKDCSYYLPQEPGDGVSVGFLKNNLRHPVVFGRPYGSKTTPPASLAPPSTDNRKELIVTRAGTTLGFIDAYKPLALLETPAKNMVLFDEKTSWSPCSARMVVKPS